ncbi:Vacuolar membrane-associated protein iml1 [Echinococcus multilocularis]|uniref:Vacuolar membrane-associated protein iml1 n=1 Tax=Echinococcus multilocularis TaxID=6211 RepID=A0A0S4MNK4_ECHMU|nr:Vacuolar membrane-associated protein iml1 [Echinococcus multilocularis]
MSSAEDVFRSDLRPTASPFDGNLRRESVKDPKQRLSCELKGLDALPPRAITSTEIDVDRRRIGYLCKA